MHAFLFFFVITVVVVHFLIIRFYGLLIFISVGCVSIYRQKLLMVLIVFFRITIELISLTLITVLGMSKLVKLGCLWPGLRSKSRHHHAVSHSPPVLVEGSLLSHLLVL